ncbi:hypothetical protein AVEN_234410-1 [Araneus ventricosus]|uniref:Ras-like protein family member 10B n=1 Tax=Araneus ventricosus TaxID=182803 RepID=A0A4Y2AA40_ARAVE|nr:hypothetical protein AVEN_234410-1 [Araneus ventricosus]
MAGFNNSDDSFEDCEDYLQQEVQLTEPIPRVRRQAYILIVGDSRTGKSMLARSFTRFPRTAAKRYHNIAINPENRRHRRRHKNSIGLHFFCAPFRSGDDDCFRNKRLKQHPYNLIIYLFDVNRRDTFENVFNKWHPEVLDYLGIHRLPPTILVGNKIDLRSSSLDQGQLNSEAIWAGEGMMSAIKVEADHYIEVNALAEINTRNLLVKILSMLDIDWKPDF